MARCWATPEPVTVAVNGDRVRDQDGAMVAVVSLRVPSFIAHYLAHLLADWSANGDLMIAERGGEERLAAMLHEAACEAGCREAMRCPDRLEIPEGEDVAVGVDPESACLALPKRVPGSIALPPTRLEPPIG
jgi:hypothetical protein